MDDLIAEFIAEAREGIEALDSELVRFEQAPDNPKMLGEIFRLIHTIKGTCGFLGLVRLQAVAHAAETVLGGFRDGSTAVTPDAVTAVLEAVDVIRAMIESLATTGVEAPGDDRALIVRLELATRVSAAPVLTEEPSVVESGPKENADNRPLLARVGGEATLDAACELTIGRMAYVLPIASLSSLDPDRLQAALREGLCAAARGFADADHFAGRIRGLSGAQPEAILIEALLREISADLRALDIGATDAEELLSLVIPKAPAAIPPMPSPAVSVSDPKALDQSAPAVETSAANTQTIRVSVDALEHMMTVVSELVLIRNQLLQLLRLEPESPFAAPLHRLNQVTSELQEGVMTTRMQPINGAWAKLPRLVRDLAHDLGKKIELTLRGQDTELDRQVLELIKDPLTHMIRNAADHGLEAPQERLTAGKPETGRIILSARHESGAIVIEMSDDGRGLSAARIRAKAAASGVITAQQAEAMSDAEARQLIFLPGFSTASEVTAVSGRGVGMDVVRTNIEKIGGAIELSSVEGAGTRFTIQIPLTLTIVSALIVECCGERFAMPQSSVVELVSASNASGRSIEYIDGAAVLRLRDRLLPLISLQSLLGLPAENSRDGDACIVVARVGAFNFGVIVDRVFDTEEIVVKPVSTVLRHLKLYSGATILGDGAVIMILDFKGMAQDSGQTRAIEDETAVLPTASVERVAMLLFRVADGALKAVPLSAVSRIEEMADAQVERVDGRSVIQYRGRLMPVVGADGAALSDGARLDPKPLLVFARGDRAAGLFVDEIVDIVETAATSELAPAGQGALGSVIIADRATELIDVDYYWRRATGEMAIREEELKPAAQAVVAFPPAPPPALKRLLVVDQSPFCQLLLKPLLAQAGYNVTVAIGPAEALALHDAGEAFDLIMADTSTRGVEAQRFAKTFARASAWHTTPLLGLGLHAPGPQKSGMAAFDETTILEAVSDTLDSVYQPELRGAA